MRVSDSRRALFVHVPKTGGSTIDALFDREIPDARRVDGVPRHAPLQRIVAAEPGLSDYWSFGFVRNPWARMVSWWEMIALVFRNADAGREAALRKIAKDPRAWLPEGEFRHNFDRFVLEGTEKVPKVGRPQVTTLSSGSGSLVDFVGRVENFDADYNLARSKLALDPLAKAPQRNKTVHGHYRDYYNDATRDKVAQVFAADIERFGYTF